MSPPSKPKHAFGIVLLAAACLAGFPSAAPAAAKRKDKSDQAAQRAPKRQQRRDDRAARRAEGKAQAAQRQARRDAETRAKHARKPATVAKRPTAVPKPQARKSPVPIAAGTLAPRVTTWPPAKPAASARSQPEHAAAKTTAPKGRVTIWKDPKSGNLVIRRTNPRPAKPDPATAPRPWTRQVARAAARAKPKPKPRTNKDVIARRPRLIPAGKSAAKTVARSSLRWARTVVDSVRGRQRCIREPARRRDRPDARYLPPVRIPAPARRACRPSHSHAAHAAAPLTVWSWQWVGGYVWDDTWEVCLEPGHYEWRTEAVLLEPGHYDSRTICPLADLLGSNRPLPAGGKLFDADGYAYPVPADGDLVYDADGNAYRLLAIPAADVGRPLVDAAGNKAPLPPMGPVLRDAAGAAWRMILAPVRVERTWVPARHETRDVPIWIEPLYQTRHERTILPGPWQWTRHYTPWDFQLGVDLSFDF